MHEAHCRYLSAGQRYSRTLTLTKPDPSTRPFQPNKRTIDLARRLEFHYTPKHGSWLNIAEIELAVLSNMCLTQRIPDKDHLQREEEANINARNAKAASVNWRFTSQDTRRKMARLYPRFSN